MRPIVHQLQRIVSIGQIVAVPLLFGLLLIYTYVPGGRRTPSQIKTPSLTRDGALFYVLPLDIVVHIHQIADALHVVGDVGIAVDGVLDGAGRDREVDHIHRLIVVHHGVDQAAGKGIAAADTIQNIKGIELGLERVTLVPHKGFQAVLTAGVDIAHMAGNALEVGVTVDEMLENFVLLLIAGLQGDAVLPVTLSMILFVLPQVVRLDAEQYINVGQALGAVVAGILPGPQRGTEVAVKADGQALLLGGAQAAQDKIGAVFVQRRG